MLSPEQLKQKIKQQQKLRDHSLSNKAKSMPSTKQLIENAGNSLVRNVRSVAAGNPLEVSTDEKNTRFEICKGCEFFSIQDERCFKCGCYLKFKTYLKAERCPIGKW